MKESRKVIMEGTQEKIYEETRNIMGTNRVKELMEETGKKSMEEAGQELL